MSFKIDEFFPKPSEKDWLGSALKTLKLDEESELRKYTHIPTIENFEYHLNPTRDAESTYLNTFPTDIRLVREIKTGQSNLEKASDGIELILSAHPTVVHKGQKLIQVLDTSEKTFFGDDVLIDLFSIASEFSFDEEKISKFLTKKLEVENTHLLVNTNVVHESGLNMCSEIAMALSLALEHLEKIHKAKKKIYYYVSTDSMFFGNIAKLRALRYLHETILENAGMVSKNTFRIIAKPSLRATTLFNPWANSLRSTVSTAAHMIGGADFSVASGHNTLEQLVTLEEINELGLRQSRNIFHILKEESCLNYVADPSRGSYLVEDLTKQIISNSFTELKEISKLSLSDLMDRLSSRALEDAKKRQEAVHLRLKTICGINDFSDPSEDVHKKVKIESFHDEEGDLFPMRRDVKPLEVLRFRAISDKVLQKKSILIATMGKLRNINARVVFCENYFETLGIPTATCDVKDIDRVQLDQYVAVVYCAQDDDYTKLLDRFPPPKNLKGYIAGKKVSDNRLTNVYQGQNIYTILEDLLEEVSK